MNITSTAPLAGSKPTVITQMSFDEFVADCVSAAIDLVPMINRLEEQNARFIRNSPTTGTRSIPGRRPRLYVARLLRLVTMGMESRDLIAYIDENDMALIGGALELIFEVGMNEIDIRADTPVTREQVAIFIGNRPVHAG